MNNDTWQIVEIVFSHVSPLTRGTLSKFHLTRVHSHKWNIFQNFHFPRFRIAYGKSFHLAGVHDKTGRPIEMFVRQASKTTLGVLYKLSTDRCLYGNVSKVSIFPLARFYYVPLRAV